MRHLSHVYHGTLDCGRFIGLQSSNFATLQPCQALFVAPCSHVWHYKCIRPILNDHKTFPSFLCPNCRAVADLEADVDDPGAMDNWEDEEASSASAVDEKETRASSEPSGESAQQELDREDGRLATMTSRQLAVRNGVDPPPDCVEYTGVDVPPPSRATISPDSNQGQTSQSLPSLLSRRNARRITPPSRHEPLPATEEEQSTTVPLTHDALLRPITPTRSFLGDHSLFHRDVLMGDAITPGSELGPMTPTNNAGPFVFDGSAGRDAGRGPAGMTTEGSNKATLEA